MGWFGSSSSTKSKEETGAPDRKDREACWTARDKYFACLTEANEPSADLASQKGICKEAEGEYRKECAASWVDYFNKRRLLQIRQDLTAQKIAEQQNAMPSAAEAKAGRA